ncbi:MAG: Bax inhibitor-1/YccA family protein, partial [Desulfobacterales bacterium]
MDSVTMKQTQVETRVNEFVRSVYNWMAIGLALTGFTAYYAAHSEFLLNLLFSVEGNQMRPSMLFYGFIISELALVFFLSARRQRLQASTATLMFVVYAILNGLTLSFVFLAYTGASVASTFFICAATFVVASLFGWLTKRDLTSFGNFLFMGLIGIIIASVVNIFLRSSMTYMIISYIGVLVFVGLTAYDTQHLKNMAMSQPDGLDGAVIRKGAIMGALKLYLDFI